MSGLPRSVLIALVVGCLAALACYLMFPDFNGVIE